MDFDMLMSAQMSVIGGIVLDSKNELPKVIDFLKPEHFYDVWLRTVYETLIEMCYAGEPVDFITLNNRLIKKEFDEDKIKTRIVSCFEMASEKTAITHYAQIIIENYKRLKLDEIASQIALENSEICDVNEIILSASEKMTELVRDKPSEGLRSLKKIIDDNFDTLFSKDSLKSRIDIGLPFVDYIVDGIYKPDLVVIGARPAVGKTAFAMQLARYVASKNKSVAFFTLEMSEKQLLQRYLSSVSGISNNKIKNVDLSKEDYIKAGKSLNSLYETQIAICDRAGISVAEIKNECRFKKDLSLIVIDYLQLIQPAKVQRYSNRAEAVGQISRDLKIMAKELDVPIIVLSQLNRAKEETSEPSLNDLRESGSIEQDADTILFLWKYDEEQSLIGCKVGKNRNGTTGSAALEFDGEHMKFLTSTNKIEKRKRRKDPWENDDE